MDEHKLSAGKRTSFGKGAARKLRAAGHIPAVIYGHGGEPQHVTLPGHETALLLRKSNVLITLDIEGATRLALIRQMNPDDWHEIVRRWKWDYGHAEIEWITLQRHCDRATALYALCSLRPTRFAAQNAGADQKLEGFVCALASRLENGFYPNAEFALDLTMRQYDTFSREITALRATGRSPWRIPSDLLDHSGTRAPAPRYTIEDGRVQFHYEYWLRHVAR